MWCPLISAASTRWPMLKVFANLAIPRRLRVRLGLLVDSIVAQRISAWASLIDSANAAMPSELGIPPLGNPSHGFFRSRSTLRNPLGTRSPVSYRTVKNR